MKYILYNPLSDNFKGEKYLEKVDSLVDGEKSIQSLININLKDFIKSINKEDEIILVGGDGTINIFVNSLDGNIPSNNIYVYAAGTGNDFFKDVEADTSKLLLVNKYLKNLPVVTINNEKHYFINGIGFGIDGYCCEVADIQKQKGKKKINYTMIAIKGLLFHFKSRKAKITVDGVTYFDDYVWIAASMKGRYYGGGMEVAPVQNRLDENRTLSNVVFKCKSKLRTLMVFPKIFKGEHVNNKKVTRVLCGKHIKVEFDRPTALQVDGETFLNVTSYEVNI